MSNLSVMVERSCMDDSCTVLKNLSGARTEEIRENLCNNQEFCDCFKLFEDRLNELLPMVPQRARNKLYDLESAVNEIISISNDQGFRDGINRLQEIMGVKHSVIRKPKYMLIEFESRRKDACRQHPGMKFGWVYKIIKVLREYTDEAEAGKDLDRLKAGKITEDELACRN